VILAIDPGLRHCGMALFREKLLIDAALVRITADAYGTAEAARLMALEVGRWKQRAAWGLDLVIELPKVYPTGRQKGDQNDLIKLAALAGALVGSCDWQSSRFVEPRTWKGTLDADAMTERITERITVDEFTRVDLTSPKSLHHNIWDAVGIGLWACGRLEPRKVYPR